MSIFKPQVGFFDVRKCFTDYCTALSIVTTCQKNGGQKILDILSWEPIYLGHIVPQSFPHQKNILGVKLSPQFQVLPPENSHKCPCSVSLYIRHFLSSNPHALSLYEKKKIFVNHNLHIKTNSFLQCSSNLFGKLTQVMKRSLNHKKKRLGNFQVIFGKTTNDLEFSFLPFIKAQWSLWFHFALWLPSSCK